MTNPYPSTKLRTLVKALGWETIALVITLVVAYVVFRDVHRASLMTFVMFVIKVAFLFLYERLWHNISWGKG